MATYEIGFKPTVAPTDSSAAITRTFSHIPTDLTALGSTIAPRHLVSAGQKITGAYYYIRASTNGVAGTVTAAAYVTDSGTNAAGARIANWTHGTSSSTPGWNYVALDVDLNSYTGQYIKPAGGYSVNNRPYYVTGTSGQGVYVNADTPNPYGSPINTTQVHAVYLVIEDVATANITDVNTTEEIRVNSSGNQATVANYSASPNAVSFSGKACTGVSYSNPTVTFVVPNFVDGQTYPEVGVAHDLTISNSVPQSDTISVTLLPPADHLVVPIASAISNNSRYLGYYLTLNDGDKVIFPSESGDFVVYANGEVEAVETGVRQLWHWNNATDVMTLLNVTVNEAGIVNVTIGDISLGIGIGIGI